MTSPEDASIDDGANPISAQLLIEMHRCAQQLLASESALLRSWGEHLMQDWRSLELIAERHRD
jgi:hypothetical protein